MLNKLTKFALGAGVIAGGAYLATQGSKSTTMSTQINPTPVPAAGNQEEKKAVGLNGKDFYPLKITDIKPYNYNTRLYTFALDDASGRPDFPLTSFVSARAVIDDKPVARPYTPIHTGDPNTMTLLVKSYPNGQLSKRFGEFRVGDVVDIKGPIPKYKYTPNESKEIFLIAGGSGITPCLQLAEGILRNPEDKTNVHLIFGNIEEKDILLREEIENLAKKNPKRFDVKFALDKPPASWNGISGYINANTLKSILPPPSDKVKVFVCGPPAMMKSISGPKAPDYTQGEVDGALKELGYTSANVYKF